MKEIPGPIPGMTPGIELIPEISPYVRHCGDDRRPAWRLGERRLLDYLLVYIAEGSGVFSLAGDMWDVAENDLFWVPPDTVHAMEGLPPGMVCPYVHFDLVYRPSVSHWDFSIPEGMTDLSELAALMHPPVKHPAVARLRGRIRSHTNRRVGELIRDICGEAARAQAFSGLRMSGMMVGVIAEIVRGQQGLAGEPSEHVPQLEEAERFMRLHCQEELPVESLAGLAGLSPSHFRHLFGKVFGRSPREHLRRLRIRKSIQLMIGSDYTFSEIALRCGFSTVHSFSRAFRAVEGVSPSQYRRYGPALTRVEGRAVPYIGSGGASHHASG